MSFHSPRAAAMDAPSRCDGSDRPGRVSCVAGRLAIAWMLVIGLVSGTAARALAQQPPQQPIPPQRQEAADRVSVGDAMAVAVAVEQAVIAAVARAAPSVVAIARVPHSAQAGGGASALTFNLPGLDRPLVDPTSPDYVPTEFASGVILSDDGMILTCYHVLDDPAAHDYYVWWRGQGQRAVVQRSPAQLRAGDPWTDMAVLKIDAQGLPPMPMGDAAQLRRGSFVITLGNPYATARDGRASAGWGIVSNLQRSAVPVPQRGAGGAAAEASRDQLQQFGTLIQTDARLDHGSSGGALVNLQGEMVGLTTSLASVAGYEAAAGYAIPIDAAALAAIAQLRDGRQPAFGFLGVEPTDTPDRRGARVGQVVAGMPAADAGLRTGDVIVAVDGVAIDGAVALFREMSRRAAESEVRLTVARGGLPSAPRAEESTRQVLVRLGTKQFATARPGYSMHRPPSWRGMQVGFSTALPASRLVVAPIEGRTPVAVLRVDPDTPAWRAGLRGGQFIERVAGREIARPDDFFDAVQEASGPVTIHVVGAGGRSEPVVVQP